MFFRLHLALATITVVAITGCANTQGGYRSNVDPLARTNGASGTILTSEKLRYETGSVLDAMSRHLVSMSVDKRYACPALSLRGYQNTAPGLTEPVIYVDGAKTVDTCILEMMTVNDVERVEVYPSGISPHPGLFGNSHGLILVFTRHK